MSYYTPDRWVILEITHEGQSFMKVFSGNYGGYGGSNTWKLSSVIEKIFTDEGFIEVLCASGSTYKLHNGCYGMSGYMNSIFSHWMENDTSKQMINILDKYDRTDSPHKANA